MTAKHKCELTQRSQTQPRGEERQNENAVVHAREIKAKKKKKTKKKRNLTNTTTTIATTNTRMTRTIKHTNGNI